MGMYAAAAGALMQLGSAFMGSNAANKRKNKLEGIAATPGLDPSGLTLEALQGQEQAFGPASALTEKINRFNTTQRQTLLDDSIPGYQARKNTTGNLIDSWLRGEVPQDVQDQLWNSRAGTNIGRFGGGDPVIGKYAQLKDFGLSSQAQQRLGLEASSKFNRDTAELEMGKVADVAAYLGLSPQELIGLRGNERSERMRYQTIAAGAPGGREVWAKYLNDVGGTLTGMGVGSGGGGLMDFTSAQGAAAGHGKYGNPDGA